MALYWRGFQAVDLFFFGAPRAQGQPWGKNPHNPRLIHRKTTRPQVVPVAVTAGAGGSAQTCPKHKSLFDKGKVKLSTEKANPYYYHYVFIEVIDNNIP